ncbi:MAG: cyclic nucleotide-binding domain-containing protein [Halothece sp. Uz-M2-17]|nr:cyclic nucleotide-binding domain-containing protein [Halothece sp. Uz-M2-17]
MTDILLEELTEEDLEWLVSIGEKQDLSPGTRLIQQQKHSGKLYIILQGNLNAVVANNPESVLGRAYSALSSEPELEQELFSLGEGDIAGEGAMLRDVPSPITIQTETEVSVIAVSGQSLHHHLKKSPPVASRFYRAIALLLLTRYESLLDQYINRKGIQMSPIEETPLIFGELYDSDVDWMIEQGTVETVSAETVLIQGGRATDTLYIILQGVFSISVAERKSTALNKVFTKLMTSDTEAEKPLGREIARVSKGEIIGETSLLDSRLSKFTVSSTEDSLVLAIPRQTLFLELQQKPAMSARFYRILALLLSERLTGLINRISYGKRSYKSGQSLAAGITYEDEADLDAIDNLTLGGARFDWMLRRLQVEQK